MRRWWRWWRSSFCPWIDLKYLYFDWTPTNRQSHFDISQMVNQFFPLSLSMSSIVHKSSSVLCYFSIFFSLFEQICTLDCTNNSSSNNNRNSRRNNEPKLMKFFYLLLTSTVNFIDSEYGYVDFLEFDMAFNRKMSKAFNVLPHCLARYNICTGIQMQTDRLEEQWFIVQSILSLKQTDDAWKSSIP